MFMWLVDRKPHHSSKVEPSADVQRWAIDCCYRCVVYLGDLGNYFTFISAARVMMMNGDDDDTDDEEEEDRNDDINETLHTA